MLLPGLVGFLTALPSAGAGSTTLPGITLTEAEWHKLQASRKVEDFAVVFKNSSLGLFALANTTLAATQAAGFYVRNSTNNFEITKDCPPEDCACQVIMGASCSNSTATLAVAAEPLALRPGGRGGTRSGAYEVEAATEVPLNTTTVAFTILREQYHQLMNSKCAAYAEKPLNFTADYAAVVPAALRLRLSQPRAVVLGNGARQVVFSFNASMYRDETRNLTASLQKFFLEPEWRYGCRIKVLGMDVENLWNWTPWFRNFTFCGHFEHYFHPRLDSVVNGGVARIAGVALRNLSGRIIQAVGPTVVVPVQIEGAAVASPSSSRALGRERPIAI